MKIKNIDSDAITIVFDPHELLMLSNILTHFQTENNNVVFPATCQLARIVEARWIDAVTAANTYLQEGE